jgi:hypothetical protein
MSTNSELKVIMTKFINEYMHLEYYTFFFSRKLEDRQLSGFSEGDDLNVMKETMRVSMLKSAESLVEYQKNQTKLLGGENARKDFDLQYEYIASQVAPECEEVKWYDIFAKCNEDNFYQGDLLAFMQKIGHQLYKCPEIIKCIQVQLIAAFQLIDVRYLDISDVVKATGVGSHSSYDEL